MHNHDWDVIGFKWMFISLLISLSLFTPHIDTHRHTHKEMQQNQQKCLTICRECPHKTNENLVLQFHSMQPPEKNPLQRDNNCSVLISSYCCWHWCHDARKKWWLGRYLHHTCNKRHYIAECIYTLMIIWWLCWDKTGLLWWLVNHFKVLLCSQPWKLESLVEIQ